MVSTVAVFSFLVCVFVVSSVSHQTFVFGILQGLLLQVSNEIVDHLSHLVESVRLVISSGMRLKNAPPLHKYKSPSFTTTFNL